MNINIRVHYNADCLKCHKVKKTMVRIGAFIMCDKCYQEEFNGREFIVPESVVGRKYYHWVKIYKEHP